MKKITTMLLTVCVIAGLFLVPAEAAVNKLPYWKNACKWRYSAVTEQPEAPEPTPEPMPEPEPPAETYTIRYDPNGGYWWSLYTSPTTTTSKRYTVTAGNTHTVASRPTRTLYVFAGWEDDAGNLYQPGDKITPTADMSLHAKWTYNG